MPYKIFAIKKEGKVIGYKVGKEDRSIMANGKRYLSNKPLSKKKAIAQLRAVGIRESMGSPVPIKTPLNFVISVPYGYCYDENDELCNKTAETKAKELFKKMTGLSTYTEDDQKDYKHYQHDNINLLVPKLHKSTCDFLREDCRGHTNFVEKMDQLVNENGIDRTVVMNIHSFPKGDPMDSETGGHMVLVHPKGRELHTLMLRDIMMEIFKKNPVLMEDQERNLLHERYMGSPLVVSVYYPDY